MDSLGLLMGVLFALILAGADSARAQRPEHPPSRGEHEGREGGNIRGRVVAPDGSRLSAPVKLTLRTFQSVLANAYTDSQGEFEFARVMPGEYVLEVEADASSFDPVSQDVRVYKGMPSVLTVSLKAKSAAVRAAPAAPVVSAGEIDRSIPDKARKEFERANRAAAEGKTAEAIAHLRKAVSIHPDFLMARNDLGAQLLAAGRFDEAAEHLRHAVRLDPKAFNPHLNLGIVLATQRQWASAAQVLEKAISLNPSSPAARLYAGQSLAALGESGRAERELQAAYTLGGKNFALALFHLGHLYLNRGERGLAVKSFEAYLGAAPDAPNAEQVRQLLGMLR